MAFISFVVEILIRNNVQFQTIDESFRILKTSNLFVSEQYEEIIIGMLSSRDGQLLSIE